MKYVNAKPNNRKYRLLFYNESITKEDIAEFFGMDSKSIADSITSVLYGVGFTACTAYRIYSDNMTYEFGPGYVLVYHANSGKFTVLHESAIEVFFDINKLEEDLCVK